MQASAETNKMPSIFQLIVQYQTKISLHLSKDFEIFCEGEWEQSQQLTQIFDNDSNAAISQRLIDLGQTGLVSLVGHIGSVDHNSSVNCNGLVGQNNLDNHNGLVEHDGKINPNGLASKLIVICDWTKISLIFQEDCNLAFDRNLAFGLLKAFDRILVFGLIMAVGHNMASGLTMAFGRNELIELIMAFGLNELIELNDVGPTKLIVKSIGLFSLFSLGLVSITGLIGHISLVGLGGFSGISSQ